MQVINSFETCPKKDGKRKFRLFLYHQLREALKRASRNFALLEIDSIFEYKLFWNWVTFYSEYIMIFHGTCYF